MGSGEGILLKARDTPAALVWVGAALLDGAFPLSRPGRRPARRNLQPLHRALLLQSPPDRHRTHGGQVRGTPDAPGSAGIPATPSGVRALSIGLTAQNIPSRRYPGHGPARAAFAGISPPGEPFVGERRESRCHTCGTGGRSCLSQFPGLCWLLSCSCRLEPHAQPILSGSHASACFLPGAPG